MAIGCALPAAFQPSLPLIGDGPLAAGTPVITADIDEQRVTLSAIDGNVQCFEDKARNADPHTTDSVFPHRLAFDQLVLDTSGISSRRQISCHVEPDCLGRDDDGFLYGFLLE